MRDERLTSQHGQYFKTYEVTYGGAFISPQLFWTLSTNQQQAIDRLWITPPKTGSTFTNLQCDGYSRARPSIHNIITLTSTLFTSHTPLIPAALQIGHDYGIRNIGMMTMRTLRVEKFIPFWAEELDSTTTPYEVGRGYKVKLNVRSGLVN